MRKHPLAEITSSKKLKRLSGRARRKDDDKFTKQGSVIAFYFHGSAGSPMQNQLSEAWCKFSLGSAFSQNLGNNHDLSLVAVYISIFKGGFILSKPGQPASAVSPLICVL